MAVVVIDTEKDLTTRQVGKMLKIAADTVKKYCQEGTIRARKVGSTWWITRAEAERYRKESASTGRPKNASK